MSNSWMYDGFPLKRADDDTRGDDYQFVIRSMDAAIRHLFGIPVGVSLTPAFSIAENGSVEVLQTFAIGTEVQINQIVDEIEVTGTTADDSRLANVTAIRDFTLAFIDEYLAIQDAFVLTTGDTMTGPLVAEGGITASVDLSIENALFANAPRLPDKIALQSEGRELIQWDDAVLVGDPGGALAFTGAGTRPTYGSESVAFVSDIVAAVASPGIDYVPEAGGTFTGLVNFDAGLQFPTALGPIFEYNTGLSSFTFAYVFDDVSGEVEVGAPGGVRFANEVKLDQTLQVEFAAVWRDIIEVTTDLNLGSLSIPLNLRGSGINPEYNGLPLALLSDTIGAYTDGSGITFQGAGPIEIEVTENGIGTREMPVGINGQYLRLEYTGPSTGEVVWAGLDVVAGTGMEVTENPANYQLTVGIADFGVDTLQLADDAVNQDKILDASVGYEQILADQGAVVPATDFTLVMRDDNLEWRKGGSILGTVEDLSTSDSFVYGGSFPTPFEELLSASNGPYVIHSLVLYQTTLAGDISGYQITIDGTVVKTSSASQPAGETDVEIEVLAGPMFAKESFLIECRAPDTSGVNRAYWSCAVTRLN